MSMDITPDRYALLAALRDESARTSPTRWHKLAELAARYDLDPGCAAGDNSGPVAGAALALRRRGWAARHTTLGVTRWQLTEHGRAALARHERAYPSEAETSLARYQRASAALRAALAEYEAALAALDLRSAG